MTTPTLSDYQLQIGTLVMGAGTLYHVRKLSGLGQPDRRAKDVPRPLADGDFRGSSFYESRTVTIELNLVATSDSAATALLTALSLQWRGSSTLYLRQPGWGETRAIEGEPRRMHADDRTTLKFGDIPVVLEYYSPTPAIYADVETTGSPPSGTGGMTLPATLPVTLGTSTSGLMVSVTNSGDYDYPPTMRVYGPFTDATITRSSDSAFLGVAGVSVASGQYIEIDMDARTIVRSDGVNQRRYMTLGSEWMTLPPGSETFTLTVSGSTAATTYLAIDQRSAWLAA